MLILMVLSVMLEVFLRQLFNRPQEWVVEFSEYALLYITFLSCASILRRDGHITVDLITCRFRARTRNFLSVIHYGICTVVSFIFVTIGAKTTLDHYFRGIYNPTILQIPMAYILLVIPIGGVFILVQSLIGLYSSYQELKSPRPSSPEEG